MEISETTKRRYWIEVKGVRKGRRLKRVNVNVEDGKTSTGNVSTVKNDFLLGGTVL